MRTVSLRQSDLVHQGCATPGCTEDHDVLYLHSICHPRSKTESFYTHSTGLVTVQCGTCKKFIASFKVAA